MVAEGVGLVVVLGSVGECRVMVVVVFECYK